VSENCALCFGTDHQAITGVGLYVPPHLRQCPSESGSDDLGAVRPFLDHGYIFACQARLAADFDCRNSATEGGWRGLGCVREAMYGIVSLQLSRQPYMAFR